MNAEYFDARGLPRFQTIDDVKSANRVRGHHFFETGAMRFFRSHCGRKLYVGRYFITSEQFEASHGFRAPRAYTIREVTPDGAVNTVGAFQGYETSGEAVAAIMLLIADQLR